MAFSRRDFIRVAGMAALAPGIWSSRSQAQTTDSILTDTTDMAGVDTAKGMLKAFGIQLYTLRDVIAKDTRNVLSQLAKDGYKELEAFGIDSGKFHGFAAADFKKMVGDLGMKTIGAHAMPDVQLDKDTKQGLDVVVPGWKKSVETAKVGGLMYITCPWWKEAHRKTVDQLKKSAEIISMMGDYATQQGLKFTYHNHDFEFADIEGTNFYDILLAQTHPSTINFEMDLYWVVFAGKDPGYYFAKYPGRFHQFHVKDMDKSDRTKNTEIGKGSIDFAKIFQMARKSGVKHYFVEQETGYSPDSLTSAKLCADYLLTKK